MKKLLMSAAFIALVCNAVPADAGSTLAIGGGANLGNVTTLTGAGALGNAAAASGASSACSTMTLIRSNSRRRAAGMPCDSPA